jgi:hypothetical protein
MSVPGACVPERWNGLYSIQKRAEQNPLGTFFIFPLRYSSVFIRNIFFRKVLKNFGGFITKIFIPAPPKK